MIIVESDSTYCGSRNSGYEGVITRWNTTPGWLSPSRNGCSLLTTWISWPRAPRHLASSVATMPLPPIDA
jgi:hypothetical protein